MRRGVLALVMAVTALVITMPGAWAQIQLPSQQQPSGTPSPPRTGIQPPKPQAAPTQYWDAIAFTADGSYSSAWKYASKAETVADSQRLAPAVQKHSLARIAKGGWSRSALKESA